MDTRASGLKGDLAVAGALAAVLGVGWTVRDWPALSAMRLPDTDDVMRLQQVRDWLGGQRFGDLTQHRLGAGVPMHWSRLADLGPAALIEGATPLVGRHAAELAAVIAWPIALFALALALVGRVARVAAGPDAARSAIVVAAIAYPATTIFLPGRIDHHGLQLVLLLGALLATLGAPGVRRGLIAGGCAAASVVVGLETAPLLGVMGAAAAIGWMAGEAGAERRLLGWGAGALAGLVIGRIVFAPDAFTFPACDGFTLDAWRAGLTASGGAFALGLLGVARPALSVRARCGICVTVGVAVAAGAISVAPRCLAPYGGVDPLLVRLWLSQVGEARPLFAAPAATAIGYAGLMLAGIVATAWRLRVAPSRAWAVLIAVQAAAMLVTVAQVRGAYAGAMLGAPALAAAIVAARARSAPALAAAWLASAGMLYPIAASATTRTRADDAPAASCSSPAVIARLAQLPPGTLLAPIDTGAWAIGATRLRVVAGPYHRNNDGNLAAYRFLLGPSGTGHRIATAWHVRYVLVCDHDVDMANPASPSMAKLLARDGAPTWLVPIAAPSADVHLYEVR